MADNDGDLGSFLTGFILGGLIGAGAALLFAPQSGEQTRTMLRERGIELRDRADDEIRELRQRADETLADFRKQAADVQEKAMKAVDEARTRLTETGEQLIERTRGKGKEAAG